ncbi:MAG: methylated-DNA--[protein]-cysteine S-methyltransferase [Rhodospirillales bacterium]|nr:methylated-DNA--[protein]-cysteine S-methyltransferase [Rhodospirillales bacterium]MDP6646651.1 methylated-DNA--[protein]-cysteine S-methyltransferase [Rhodospirillales bacterium]
MDRMVSENFSPAVDLARRVCLAIEAFDEGTPTLAELGADVGLSPSHMQRTFKKILGISPREFAEATRLERFKLAVRAGGNVADALYEAGFGSSRGLYETAKPRLGMTPASYGKGGKGAVITYALEKCDLGNLGYLLLAATGHGVCKIAFADTEAELTGDLAREFPRADRRRDDRALAELVAALGRQLQGGAGAGGLPLDIRATAFQARVWNHLRMIPAGETRSYGEVARALDLPAGARAVARACAANPAALAVPCHRVVGSDGRLRGYRWGLRRKRELLAREGAQIPKGADP